MLGGQFVARKKLIGNGWFARVGLISIVTVTGGAVICHMTVKISSLSFSALVVPASIRRKKPHGPSRTSVSSRPPAPRTRIDAPSGFGPGHVNAFQNSF